jgi:peroxiredoxin
VKLKKRIVTLGLLALGFWLGISFAWAVKAGESAPDFKAKDSYGKNRKLSDYRGKFVVLEWHNKDCPFVQSQYKGKMEKLQQEWTKKGVVWFIVNSSAPGKDGYVTAAKANLDVKRHGAVPTAALMDPAGVIGRAYGAKTTPHMFVIDPKGIVLYNGAVDNAPLEDELTARNQEGKPCLNYVDQALQEAVRGAEVSIPTTAPYGCSVKYK